MSLCQFAPTDKPHEFKCEVCGGTYRDEKDRPRRRVCSDSRNATRSTKAGGGCGGCGPSLIKKAANLAGAAIGWAANGFRMATDEEQAARLAICHACEFLQANGECSECGCPVARKAAIFASEDGKDCPRGKWDGPVG